MIKRKQLIESYIEFFKKKNHKEILNSSLIPENDPTVLFTTAGMHPLVPYLLGQLHPSGKRLCNVQRCIRTGDIEEVGNTTHHTFFEMLGNWSLGDYWKKEAIEYSFEFLTKILKIPIKKLAVSIFAGNKDAGKDEDSFRIWEKLGIPRERIAFLPKKDNWWGPAGKTGPCGPDTEMFYYKKENPPKKFNPEDKNWMEIWNDVFMQYNKDDKENYNPAKQKNIDTGMGVERTLAVLNGFDDNYLTEIWQPIIKKIEELTGKKYNENEKEMRIIADHIKASVFIIADGITPGNTEQGYVLRRLIRKAIRNLNKLGMRENFYIEKIAEKIIEIYSDYEHLQKNNKKILHELKDEEEKFAKTLEKGMNAFEKIIKNKNISGKDAFLIYQSYGFPLEMTKEIAQERKIKINEKEFEQELEKHQKLSRTATQGRFKSGLADKGEETTKLHTATHLLAEALRQVLKKPDLHQKGSNITAERLRFDFNFGRKLTDEELKKVEDLVNKKINENLEVVCREMTLEEAKKCKAQGVFEDRYCDKVFVYDAGGFSKEICAGPHVKSTKELGHLKIIKEESSSAGVRRIKAVLE